MARIDGVEIPPEIIEELKRMLLDAPDKALREVTQEAPELAKGFRPGSHAGLNAVRARMTQLLIGDHDIDPLLLSIMNMGGKTAELCESLSDMALEDTLPALAAVYGRNRLLAALLTDCRESVRDLALNVLESESDLPVMDIAAAREMLRDRFMGAVCDMIECLDIPKPGAKTGIEAAESAVVPRNEVETWKNRAVEAEAKLKQQETRARDEKLLQRKLETLRQRNEQLEKELNEARKSGEREKRSRDEIKADLRKTREERDALLSSINEKVSRAVAEELSSLRQRWLGKPVLAEREANAIRALASGGDPVARAEELLAKQAEIDRNSGNIATLRKRMEKLRATIGGIVAARADALHPLAELGRVERELNAELARLQAVVGEPRSAAAGVFLSNMLARINCAESGDDLAELKTVLDRLGDIEALSAPELQELYRCYHDRMSRLYASFTPAVIRREKRFDDPVWRLRIAVEENEQIIVILDGHNILHLLPNLFDDSYGKEGEPGRAARERLVGMVFAIFKESDNCRAEIFFDGPTQALKARAENVHEVYSGGAGEHRADRAIIEYLEYCARKMSAMPRILITDDRDLRSKAAELSARIMPVPQFGAFLQEMR